MNESQPSKEVRFGSPFAIDPPAPQESSRRPRDDADELGTARASTPGNQSSTAAAYYAAGPLRYTAMGAVAASAMVLVFAAAAWWWFPSGGTIVAAWGCLLAILGMYSPMPKRAMACLLLHGLLFVLCYARVLST